MINDCMLFASFCSSKKTIGCDGINILFLYCVYLFCHSFIDSAVLCRFYNFWLHWFFLPRVVYFLFIAYAFSYFIVCFLVKRLEVFRKAPDKCCFIIMIIIIIIIIKVVFYQSNSAFLSDNLCIACEELISIFNLKISGENTKNHSKI